MEDKRAKKMAQHFTIKCDGENAKILGYKLRVVTDGTLVLEVVTKIPNDLFSRETVYFDIDHDGARTC